MRRVLRPVATRARASRTRKSRSATKPSERCALSASEALVRAPFARPLSAASPYPNEPPASRPARRGPPSRVITWTTPPKASAPYSEDPGPCEHLDPLDLVERDRDVAVVMSRLRVVEAHAVDEHERLAERGAAQREVRLHAAVAACGDVEPAREPQRVGERAHGQRLDPLARDHVQRAPQLREARRLGAAGDDQRLLERCCCAWPLAATSSSGSAVAISRAGLCRIRLAYRTRRSLRTPKPSGSDPPVVDK